MLQLRRSYIKIFLASTYALRKHKAASRVQKLQTQLTVFVGPKAGIEQPQCQS